MEHISDEELPLSKARIYSAKAKEEYLTNSLIKGKGKKKEEEGEVAVFRSYLPSSSTRQSSIRQLAHFPSIEEAMGVDPKSPLGIAAREVWGWFIDHLDSLLESARAFRFDEFEQRLRMFWSNLGTIHREVVHTPVIATLITKTDAIVYDAKKVQEILEILRSQILSPIEATSLASIRQLGNKMENILLAALDSYNNTFVEIRVVLGARFGHRLLRLLDLYHVTQALNTVLTNTKRLGEMRKSWQNIDFDTIRNQSALVCNCRHEDLQLLEVEFAATLDSLPKSTEPVKEVIAWADNGFERLCVGKSAGKSPSLRSVLIRWSYVMDQIIRDLTIRGDPSSGAFQIVRIFLHDWIGCNVLRSVVLSVNSIEPERQQQSTSLTSTPGALRDVSDLSVAHSTDLSS
ncbi:hypothetical protein B0H13DRAFT_1612524 [Mycena leptocephala]|nr:hypothetical protein B0H13DRAFT_1612524 [Mycena leptocephala]